MKTQKRIFFIQFLIILFIVASLTNAQKIYFAGNQNGLIQSADYNGSNLSTLVNSSQGLYGVAVDLDSSLIFYTNVITDEIIKANLDGTNPSVILNNSSNGVDGPRGIAVDGTNNKIYWVENGSDKLRSSDFNGNNVKDILTGLSSPRDVSLDLVNNKIYYSENGIGAKKISKCNLDGSSIEAVVTGLNQVSGLSLDLKNQKLFWVDFGTNKIMSSDLNGGNIQTLDSLTSGIRDIAVDNSQNKIFWSDVINNSVTQANIDGTSPTEILTGLSYPLGINHDWFNSLPVELVSFSANVDAEKVDLIWSTVTEVDSYGFEIDRKNNSVQFSSSDRNEINKKWKKIGFIPGGGTSNKTRHYSFEDLPKHGTNFSYRLKQIDNSGNYKYSNVINVKIDFPSSFNLSQNYPNPFNPSTNINYSLPVESNVNIVVYNTLGKKIKRLVSGLKSAGYHTINFNASDLSSGIYYYSITANSINSGNSYRMIKKMILLK